MKMKQHKMLLRHGIIIFGNLLLEGKRIISQISFSVSGKEAMQGIEE